MQSNFEERNRLHNGQESSSSQSQSYSSQPAPNLSGPPMHPALSALPSRNYSTPAHLDEYFNNCVYQSKILSGQRPGNPSYKRNAPSDYPSDKRPYVCYSSCCQSYPPSPYSMNATATASPIQFPFGRFNQQNVAENIGLQDHLLQNQQPQPCQQTDFHYLQSPTNPIYNQRVSHVNSRETPSGIGSHYATSNYLHHSFYNTRPNFPPEYYKRTSNKSTSLKVNSKQQTSVIKSSNDFPYASEKPMTPINYTYNKRPESFLPSYLPSCSQANFPLPNQYSSHRSAGTEAPPYHSSFNYPASATASASSLDSKPQPETAKKNSSKPPLNIDVRQFLATWDDDDDEPGATSVESQNFVAIPNKSSQPTANPDPHDSQPNENPARSECSVITADQENSVLFKILKPTAERRGSHDNPYVTNMQHYPYNQVQLSTSNLPVDAHVNTSPALRQPYPKTIPNFSAPMFHPDVLGYRVNEKCNKPDYNGGKIVNLTEKMCNSPSPYPLPLDQTQTKTPSSPPKRTYFNLEQNVIKNNKAYPPNSQDKTTARSTPSSPTVDYDLRDQEQFIKPIIINKADYLKKDKSDETIGKFATKASAKKMGKGGKERNVSVVSPNVQRSDKVLKPPHSAPYNEMMSQFHNSQIPYNKTTLMPYCISPSNQLPNSSYEYPMMSVINNSHNYIKYDNRPNYTSEEQKYDNTCSVNINLSITSDKSPQVFLNRVSAQNPTHGPCSTPIDSSRLITGAPAEGILKNSSSQDVQKTEKQESDARKPFGESCPSNLPNLSNRETKSTSFISKSIPESIPEVFQIQSLIGPCKTSDHTAGFRSNIKDSTNINVNKVPENAPVNYPNFHQSWSKMDDKAGTRNQFDEPKSSYNSFCPPAVIASPYLSRQVENCKIMSRASVNGGSSGKSCLFEPVNTGSSDEKTDRLLPHFASSQVLENVGNISTAASMEMQCKSSEKTMDFDANGKQNTKVFDTQYYKSCLYDSSSFKKNIPQESAREKSEEFTSPFLISKPTLDINSNSIDVKEKVNLTDDSARDNFSPEERAATNLSENKKMTSRDSIVRASDSDKNTSPISCSFTNTVITSTHKVNLDQCREEIQEKCSVDASKNPVNLMPGEISMKSKNDSPPNTLTHEENKDANHEELFVDEETIDSIINERCDTFGTVEFSIESNANAKNPPDTANRISPLSLLHFPEAGRAESVDNTLDPTNSPQENLQAPLKDSKVLEIYKKTNPLENPKIREIHKKTKVVCGMADLLNSDSDSSEREDESIKEKLVLKKKSVSNEFASFDLFNDNNETFFSDVSCSKSRDKCSSKNKSCVTDSAAVNDCYSVNSAVSEKSQSVEGSKTSELTLTKSENHADFEILVQNEMTKFNFESDILNISSLEVEPSQFFNEQNQVHEPKVVSQAGSDSESLSCPEWERAEEAYNINPNLKVDTSENTVTHMLQGKTCLSSERIADPHISENCKLKEQNSSGYDLSLNLEEKTDRTIRSENSSLSSKEKSRGKKHGKKQSRKTPSSSQSTELSCQKFNADNLYANLLTNSSTEKEIHDKVLNLNSLESEISSNVRQVPRKRKLHGLSVSKSTSSEALYKTKIKSIDSLLENDTYEPKLSPVPSCGPVTVSESIQNVVLPEFLSHLPTKNNEAVSSSNEPGSNNQRDSNSELILPRMPSRKKKKKKKKKRRLERSVDLSARSDNFLSIDESCKREEVDSRVFDASHENMDEEIRTSMTDVAASESISHMTIPSNEKFSHSHDRQLIVHSADYFKSESRTNTLSNQGSTEELNCLDLSVPPNKFNQKVEISVNPPSDEGSNHSFDEKIGHGTDNYFKRCSPDSPKFLHMNLGAQKLRNSLSQSSSADSNISSPLYQTYEEPPERCDNEIVSSPKFSSGKLNKRFRNNLSESSSVGSIISISASEKTMVQDDCQGNDKSSQAQALKYLSNDDEESLGFSSSFSDSLKANQDEGNQHETQESQNKLSSANDAFFFQEENFSRTPKKMISPIRSRSDTDTYSDTESVDDKQRIEQLCFKNASVTTLNSANKQFSAVNDSPVIGDVIYERADSPISCNQCDLQESLLDENLDEEVENCLKEVISIRFKINNPPDNLIDLKTNEVVDPGASLHNTEGFRSDTEKLPVIELKKPDTKVSSEDIVSMDSSPTFSPSQSIEFLTVKPNEELSSEKIVLIDTFPIRSPSENIEPHQKKLNMKPSENMVSIDSPSACDLLQNYVPFKKKLDKKLSSENISAISSFSAGRSLQNNKPDEEKANEKCSENILSVVYPPVCSSLQSDEHLQKEVNAEPSPEDTVSMDSPPACSSLTNIDTVSNGANLNPSSDDVHCSFTCNVLQNNEPYKKKSHFKPYLDDSVLVESSSTASFLHDHEPFVKEADDLCEDSVPIDNSTACNSLHNNKVYQVNMNRKPPSQDIYGVDTPAECSFIPSNQLTQKEPSVEPPECASSIVHPPASSSVKKNNSYLREPRRKPFSHDSVFNSPPACGYLQNNLAVDQIEFSDIVEQENSNCHLNSSLVVSVESSSDPELLIEQSSFENSSMNENNERVYDQMQIDKISNISMQETLCSTDLPSVQHSANSPSKVLQASSEESSHQEFDERESNDVSKFSTSSAFDGTSVVQSQSVKEMSVLEVWDWFFSKTKQEKKVKPNPSSVVLEAPNSNKTSGNQVAVAKEDCHSAPSSDTSVHKFDSQILTEVEVSSSPANVSESEGAKKTISNETQIYVSVENKEDKNDPSHLLSTNQAKSSKENLTSGIGNSIQSWSFTPYRRKSQNTNSSDNDSIKSNNSERETIILDKSQVHIENSKIVSEESYRGQVASCRTTDDQIGTHLKTSDDPMITCEGVDVQLDVINEETDSSSKILEQVVTCKRSDCSISAEITAQGSDLNDDSSNDLACATEMRLSRDLRAEKIAKQAKNRKEILLPLKYQSKKNKRRLESCNKNVKSKESSPSVLNNSVSKAKSREKSPLQNEDKKSPFKENIKYRVKHKNTTINDADTKNPSHVIKSEQMERMKLGRTNKEKAEKSESIDTEPDNYASANKMKSRKGRSLNYEKIEVFSCKLTNESKPSTNKRIEISSSLKPKYCKDTDNLKVKKEKSSSSEKTTDFRPCKISKENKTIFPVASDSSSQVEGTFLEKKDKDKYEPKGVRIEKGRNFREQNLDITPEGIKENDAAAISRDRSPKALTNNVRKRKIDDTSKTEKRSSRHENNQVTPSKSKTSDITVTPRRSGRSKDEMKFLESKKKHEVSVNVAQEKNSNFEKHIDVVRHKTKKSDTYSHVAKRDKFSEDEAKHTDVKNKHGINSTRVDKEKMSNREKNDKVISDKVKENNPDIFLTTYDKSLKDKAEVKNKIKHRNDGINAVKEESSSLEKKLDLTSTRFKENNYPHDLPAQNGRFCMNVLKPMGRSSKPVIDKSGGKEKIPSFEKNVERTSLTVKTNTDVATARNDAYSRVEAKATDNESRHKIEAYCPVRNWECPFVSKDRQTSIRNGSQVESWNFIESSVIGTNEVNHKDKTKSVVQTTDEAQVSVITCSAESAQTSIGKEETERPKTPKSCFSGAPKTPDICIEQTPEIPENCFESNLNTPETCFDVTPKVSESYYDRPPKTPEPLDSLEKTPKTPEICFGRVSTVLESHNQYPSTLENFRETPKTPESCFGTGQEKDGLVNEYQEELTARQPSLVNLQETENTELLKLTNELQQHIIKKDRSSKSERCPEKRHHEDKYESSKKRELDHFSRKNNTPEVTKYFNHDHRTEETKLKPKHLNDRLEQEILSSKSKVIRSKFEVKASNSEKHLKQNDILSGSPALKTQPFYSDGETVLKSKTDPKMDTSTGNKPTKSQVSNPPSDSDPTVFTPYFDLDFDKQEINFDNFHILFDQTWEKFSKLKESNKKSKETLKSEISSEKNETQNKKSLQLESSKKKQSCNKNASSSYETSSTSDKANIKFKINFPDKNLNSSEMTVPVNLKSTRYGKEVNSEVNDNLKLLQNVFGTNKTRYKPSISQFQTNSNDVPCKLTFKVNPSLTPDNPIYFAENYRILDVSKIPLPPFDAKSSRISHQKGNVCVQDSNVINYKLLAMMGTHLPDNIKKDFKIDFSETITNEKTNNADRSPTSPLPPGEPIMKSVPVAFQPVNPRTIESIIPKNTEVGVKKQHCSSSHNNSAEKPPSSLSLASKTKDKDTLYCNFYKKLLKNKRLNKEKERLSKEKKLEMFEHKREIFKTTSKELAEASLPTAPAKPGIVPLPFEPKNSQIDRNSAALLDESCRDEIDIKLKSPLKSKLNEQQKEELDESLIRPEEIKLKSKLILSQKEIDLTTDDSFAPKSIESENSLSIESARTPFTLPSKTSGAEEESNNDFSKPEFAPFSQSSLSELEEKPKFSTWDETSHKLRNYEPVEVSDIEFKTVSSPDQPNLLESTLIRETAPHLDSKKSGTTDSSELLTNKTEKVNLQEKQKNPDSTEEGGLHFYSKKSECFRATEGPISKPQKISTTKKFKSSSGSKVKHYSDKSSKSQKQNQGRIKKSNSSHRSLKNVLPSTTAMVSDPVEEKLNFGRPTVKKGLSLLKFKLSEQGEDKTTPYIETNEKPVVLMKEAYSSEGKLEKFSVESEEVLLSPVLTVLSSETSLPPILLSKTKELDSDNSSKALELTGDFKQGNTLFIQSFDHSNGKTEIENNPDGTEIVSSKPNCKITEPEICVETLVPPTSFVGSPQESQIMESVIADGSYQTEMVDENWSKSQKKDQQSLTEQVSFEKSVGISQSSIIEGVKVCEEKEGVPIMNEDEVTGGIKDSVSFDLSVNKNCAAEKTMSSSHALPERISLIIDSSSVESSGKTGLENNLFPERNKAKKTVSVSKIGKKEEVTDDVPAMELLTKMSQERTLVKAVEELICSDEGKIKSSPIDQSAGSSNFDNPAKICSSEFVSEISMDVVVSQDAVPSCQTNFLNKNLTEMYAEHKVDTLDSTDLSSKNIPSREFIQPEHTAVTYSPVVETEIFGAVKLTQENRLIGRICTPNEQPIETVSAELKTRNLETVEPTQEIISSDTFTCDKNHSESCCSECEIDALGAVELTQENVSLNRMLILNEQFDGAISAESELTHENMPFIETCHAESETEILGATELTQEITSSGGVNRRNEKPAVLSSVDSESAIVKTAELTQETILPHELCIGDKEPVGTNFSVSVTEVFEAANLTQKNSPCSVTSRHDPTTVSSEPLVHFSDTNHTMSENIFEDFSFNDRVEVDALSIVNDLPLLPSKVILAADTTQNSPKNSVKENILETKIVLDPPNNSSEGLIPFEEAISVEPLYFNVEAEVVIGSNTDESRKGRTSGSSAEDESVPSLIIAPVSENLYTRNDTSCPKRRKKRGPSRSPGLNDSIKQKKSRTSQSSSNEIMNRATENYLQQGKFLNGNLEEINTNDDFVNDQPHSLDGSGTSFDRSGSFQISNEIDNSVELNSVIMATSVSSESKTTDEGKAVNTFSNLRRNTFNSEAESCFQKIDEKVSFLEPIERESFSTLKKSESLRKCKSVELLPQNILSPEVGSIKSSRSVNYLRLKSSDSESSVSPNYLKGFEVDCSNSFVKCFSFLKDNMPFIADPSSCLTENEMGSPSLTKEIIPEISDALCLPVAGSPMDENLASTLCESQLRCINNCSVNDTFSYEDRESLANPSIDLLGSEDTGNIEKRTSDSSKSKSRDLKVRLPWNRIFNLKKRKKRNVTNSKGIELGPAKIEIRLNSSENSGSWKVIQNSSASVSSGSICSLGSPIGIKVNRLVLQRHPANDPDSLRAAQSEVCSLSDKAEIIPNVIIKKKGTKCYKSYFKFTSKREPVVRLLREKHIDLLALKLRDAINSKTTSRTKSKSHQSFGQVAEKEKKDSRSKRKSVNSLHDNTPLVSIPATSDEIGPHKCLKNISKSTKLPKLIREMQLDVPPELDLDCPVALATRRKSIEKKKASESGRIIPKDLVATIVEKMDSTLTTNVELENAQTTSDTSLAELSIVSVPKMVRQDLHNRMKETARSIESKEFEIITDEPGTEKIPDETSMDLVTKSLATQSTETSLGYEEGQTEPVKRKTRSISFDSENKETYQKSRLNCQVCCDSSQRTDNNVNIMERLFHCTRCCLEFKSHEEEVAHNSTFHKDSAETWNCSLCRKTFGSQLSLGYHFRSRLHQLLESVQTETITSLFTHFTGKDCPYLRSGCTSDHLDLENQLTPLQIVLKGEPACPEVNRS